MPGKPLIGEYIRNLLSDNKMTMKELAERSGYDPAHVSRVLSGKMNVTGDFLKRIAPYLLGTSYDKLLQVAGLSKEDEERVPPSRPPVPETASGMEQRIGELTGELMELIQKYTEYQFGLAWAKIHSQSKAQANAIQNDYRDALTLECDAQVALMRLFLDAVLEQQTANRFGYVHDPTKFELASSLQKLNDQQVDIIRSLVIQLAGGKN